MLGRNVFFSPQDKALVFCFGNAASFFCVVGITAVAVATGVAFTGLINSIINCYESNSLFKLRNSGKSFIMIHIVQKDRCFSWKDRLREKEGRFDYVHTGRYSGGGYGSGAGHYR